MLTSSSTIHQLLDILKLICLLTLEYRDEQYLLRRLIIHDTYLRVWYSPEMHSQINS